MSWRGVALGVASMVFCTAHVHAQQHPAVIEAQAAYDAVNNPGAVDAARRALADVTLSQSDRVLALELLAFSYASMDSTTQAIAAFRDLIFVDPEREPDPLVISPTITQLYVIALGQVLVLRRIEMDTNSYVAGQGNNVRVRFHLSQLASVDIRVIGNGIDIITDSGTWVGEVVSLVSGLDENGDPLPAGTYDLQITARANRDQTEGLLRFTIAHGAVDTLAHLDSLPGFAERPEMVRPPRNWMPLAISGVAAGITTGAVFAIQSDVPSSFTPVGLLTINVGVLATGLAASLRQPDLEPVVANIEFNRLLRQQLAAENATRASGNVALRRQVVLTITPVSQENR